MICKPTLVSRQLISDEIWDDHISRSQQCVIYALSWYLDIVCEEWEALVWRDGDNFDAVMPLPITRKFGKKVLSQPLFCQYLGIFSTEALTPSHFNACFHALARHFPYISAYSFNPENFRLMDATVASAGIAFEIQETHWLDLGKSYEAIFTGYSKDRKTNVRKGHVTRWQIADADDIGPLIELFASNHAAGIGTIRRNAYGVLNELVRCCLSRGDASLTYARTNARIHAGICIVRYGGRAVYLFNAADSAGRRGNARTVMLDAYFRRNSGDRLIFDFETPRKTSIAAHYESYGSTAMPFYQIGLNALPFPLRQIQRCRKWVLTKTRRYLSGGPCKI